MVKISVDKDGFVMGSDLPLIPADGEGPARVVTLDEYWLDVHEVSNSDFKEFIDTTGYVTEVRLAVLITPDI